jgi:hypothetical protein
VIVFTKGTLSARFSVTIYNLSNYEMIVPPANGAAPGSLPRNHLKEAAEVSGAVCRGHFVQ